MAHYLVLATDADVCRKLNDFSGMRLLTYSSALIAFLGCSLGKFRAAYRHQMLIMHTDYLSYMSLIEIIYINYYHQI